MRFCPSVRVVLAAVLAAATAGTTAFAQSDSTPPTPDASASPAAAARLERVGFDGYYKVGRWTSATVRLDSPAAGPSQVVVRAPDPEGCPTAVPHPVGRTGSPSEVTVHFKNGRLTATPEFELVELDGAGRPVRGLPIVPAEGMRLRPALRHSSLLVALLGEAAGLGEPLDAGRIANPSDAGGIGDPLDAGRTGNLSYVVARLASSEELPADVLGFASLDALVISGRYDLSEAQVAAVGEWVRLGGHLLVSVATDVEQYAASPLGRWLSGGRPQAEPGNEDVPVPLTGTRAARLRELTGLENFTGQHAAIEIPRREGVAAAPLGRPRGRVLVRVLGDLPVLVRIPYGLGRITVIGLDLGRPPLSQWPALPVLMHRLLGMVELSRDAAVASRSGRLAHSGITDLASQLSRARHEFPAVRRSSLWTVLGLLVGYLLLIGPLDYLLVHRVLGRPHATWVTFPLLVVAAAVLAAWTARVTNGEQVRVNRLDLVDIDGQFQTVRSRSWMTFYTPETRRYELKAEPRPFSPRSDAAAGSTLRFPPDVLVSWSGTPENVFGGMYRTGGLDLGRPAYAFGLQARSIADLPLTIWATRDLEAQWHNQAPRALVESDLRLTPAGQLRGRLTHQLPVPIEDWVVAVGRQVYLPGWRGEPVSLPPGSAWPPDADWEQIYQRDLAAWLTGAVPTRAIRPTSEGRSVQRPERDEWHVSARKYNPFDPSVPDPTAEILRMITFHRAAGGKTYSGLDNHTFRADDLSELLDLGRAVLFGRIELPATEFQLNGEPVDESAERHATFVRIVLPVAPPVAE